jgi:hypothetical protein
MITSSHQDARATNLLSRVSEDVSLLRQDISNLVSHTAHQTVTGGAREFAENARTRIAAGKEYSAEQLRALGEQIKQHPAAWLGGAAAVGLISAGAYLLFRGEGGTTHSQAS